MVIGVFIAIQKIIFMLAIYICLIYFEHRQGMPVSLGAIVLYLADVLDLPIYPVNFPTQLILRAK